MARRLGGVRRLLRRLPFRPCLAPRFWLSHDPGYARALPGVPLDPLRAQKILAALDELGLLGRARLVPPRPASAQALLRVHPAEYLQRLADPEVATRAFGLHLAEAEAQAVVESQRLMTGGTLLACRLALRGQGPAVNLGGGLHHAGRDTPLGFCLVNDVAVAIASLRAHGFDERVLVVDLDVHDGNGTRTLFARDRSVHTLSIHNDHWANVDALESTSIALGADVEDDAYLARLRDTLPALVARFAPGLVVYVAGADVARGDALGNWRLSDGAVLARDRLVAELALGARPPLPLAVALGGGYGPAAWRHPARFLAWLASGEELELPDPADLVLRRFRRMDAVLERAGRVLEKDDRLAFTLSEEDLVGVHPGLPRESRFLGLFTAHGSEVLLEGFGLLEQLRARGYRRLRVELDLEAGHTLRVRCDDTPGGELLMELRARRGLREVAGCEVLVIEWLLLQHPRAAFTAERPALPGQQHPGLGLLADVMGLLTVVCERHGLDGIYFAVSHFHLAAQSRRLVRFLEPEDQARVEALEAALRELPLGEASRRIEDGDVIDVRSGKRIAWEPAALVLPVSPRLRARLDAPERAAALQASRERHAYRLAPLRRSGRRAGTPRQRARQAPAGSSPPPRR